MTLRTSRRKRSLSGNLIRRRRTASGENKLKLESLEQRQLLAVGPQLLGIQPNTGSLLADGDTRDVAPSSLTFNFDASQALDADTLDGIRITRSGNDGIFGNGNDVIITPGYIGLGERPSEVVIRFAETLPDDQYQIEVFGFDDPAQNIEALRNDLGDPFMPADPMADRTTIDFELDLGAQVVSVVPQPVIRNADGSLSQARNQVVVYFNNDDLHATSVQTGDLTTDPTVVDPNFYRLISTFDGTGESTVTNTDDQEFLPTSINYDPALDRAVLTFADDLDTLAGEGVYRLRIGTNEVTPSAPSNVPVNVDPGDSYDTAQDIGSLTGSDILSSNISPQFVSLEFPGALDEPGHREILAEAHLGGGDGSPGATIQPYNFQDVYGFDPNTGEPFQNAITEAQKDRARDIFQIYSYYLGIQFYETANRGLTVATGDLRAADPTIPSAPGGVAGLGGPGMAVMDKAENWNDSFGGSWFDVALHEIGHAIGQGHAYDLPPGTTQGSEPDAGFGVGSEPVFPGNHDVVHGRHLHRPDGNDVDIYSFTLPETGKFTADVIAERLTNSSLLDSALQLYRQNSDGTRQLISRNDDYYSEDSHLELTLDAGTYFIAVSASGNTDYDPSQANTGLGGRSQGEYDLRLNFRPIADQVIVDATGTQFDGDADGTPGGTYNYWLRAADEFNTIFVDKVNQPPAGQPQPTGSLANPYNEIDQAFSEATRRNATVVRIVGNGGADDDLGTSTDNLPYVVGTNPVGGGALADGVSVRAPQDVTVMIDAGAIFKVNQSFISTGSNNVITDRSGSALQVLGTPEQSVFFTSYDDESIGLDTNPAILQTPQAGQWGGLVFRRDVDVAEGNFDLEQRGVFLNHVNHADIRYGGGRVSLGSVPQPVEPLFVSEARPTFSFNTITDSARAAISVDPNSFQESSFLEPEFQGIAFTPDYTRVGPDVHGNHLIDNTTNGLFIRVATPDGSSLKPLTVSARFDDTDIVHVMTENLDIQGTAGGGTSDQVTPPVALVSLSELDEGDIVPGFYNYVITYVDGSGNESAPSDPTESLFVFNTFPATGTSIQLDNLPTVPVGFVGRRIYRSSRTGDGTYSFVGQTTATSSSFVDDGSVTGAPLVASDTNIRARIDASLVINPGTIIKSNGSRIDVTSGANLIAEGNDGQPIIFTSLNDEQFGAGGTFDTNNDAGANNPQPGDWGGIYVGHTSTASIDHSLFTYAGGSAPLNGDNAGSNVIEVHQSTVRVSNSTFRDNDNGMGGSRTGRISNAPGTIFVRGAQPVIVGNSFRDNSGPVININVDALNHELQTDYGRSTGRANALPGFLGNQGPLIRQNRMSDNGLNGMLVREASLTTQSVWDDTDIVHVVTGEIVSPDFHSFGGLRLQSNPNESLVVKFSGATAGLTATGRNLDIVDRIGGTVQVVGQPGSPVILTSLGDDTVGAGFDLNGLPQTDTAGTGNFTAAPGDWQGITIAQNANDRNVGVVTEYENPTLMSPGNNATPDNAQLLGRLAPREHAGDDANRLGFEIHGQLNESSDIDTYSFNGTAGTLVWLDFDRTATSLDSVIELLDDSGQVLARVDNSYDVESGTEAVGQLDSISAGSLVHVPQRAKDYWGTNPADAGMRVVLPGAPGSTGLFYIRIRSSNPSITSNVDLPSDLLGGQTRGKYQLQLRLRDTDEIPGSTVKFAEIRYATNGITVEGQPQHSPLLGEVAEIGGAHANTTNAQSLGNLLNSDRGALSINGALGDGLEVDFYEFEVNFDSIQQIAGVSADTNYTGVTFDIDYADGLGRPDTILSIFDAGGNLVFTSRNAGINQDVPKPLNASDVDDLSRGSVGTLDPFIGTAMLSTGTYYAAVSSNTQLPQELNQLFTVTPANPNVRLEPVNSVRRIAEDHINSSYYSTAQAPVLPVLFDDDSFIPYQLGDVTLFLVQDIDKDKSRVRTVDPFTGAQENIVGNFGRDVGDLAMRSDGTLTAFSLDLDDGNGPQDASAGNLLDIDTGNASQTVINDDGIDTFEDDPDNAGSASNIDDGVHFNAMTYLDRADGRDLFAIGNRGGANANGIVDRQNILYMFSDQGVATSNNNDDREDDERIQGAGTQIVERGVIDTMAGTGQGGDITGMAFVGGRMFAVSELGDLFEITGYTGSNAQTTHIGNVGDNFALPANFAGLSVGPDSINPDPVLGTGQHEQTLFGVTQFGDVLAFDVDAQPVPTFLDGATSISTGVTNVRGLAFSTLDANPWQTTGDRNDRGSNPGHGVNIAPDDTRADQDSAGSSLYFGQRNDPNTFTDNNYDFPGGGHGSVVSNAFSLEGYASADQPVLYFNYYLDTEGVDYSPQNQLELFRDSLRAYVQDSSGEWRLVATNNEFRSNDFVDEFDVGGVATLHDNSGSWRQARVDLAQFAGQEDLRLRFDFDTAGGLNTGSAFSDSPLGLSAPASNSGLTTGTELHAIDGIDIRDGQQFSISTPVGFATTTEQTFEFESGFTLIAPTGSAVIDGETFTINEPDTGSTTYEFDSAGNGTSGANTAVIVNAGMSPGEVAQSILAVLQGGGGGGASFTLNAEGNDTLATAIPTGLAGADTLRGSGTIGDNPGVGIYNDVDMMSIDLLAGENITVDVDLNTLGDSILRIFDSAGNQLQFDDDGNAPGEPFSADSFLDFTATADDTYYIGISGYSNFNYDPTLAGSGTGGSRGSYSFEIQLNGGGIPTSAVFTPHLNGERLNVEGVTSVTQAGGNSLTVEGTSGTGGIPVFVNEDMNSEEVAEVLQGVFAQQFAAGDTNFFFRDRDMIRLIGHAATDPGPLGYVESLYGDQFGAFNASARLDGDPPDEANPGFLRGLDNNHEGAYIDDIIIGFAERGEMVTGAQPNDAFTLNPARNDNDNVQGQYQLEIRRSEDYGIPTGSDELPFLALTNTFDTNDRHAQKLSLQTVPGYQISAGETFGLSDGLSDITFEFTDTGNVAAGNVPVLFSSTDDAAQIAQRIRDIINDDSIQNRIEIVASDSSGSLGLSSTSSLVHLYGEARLIENFDTPIEAVYYDTFGDSNLFRDQGVVIVQSNYITDSSEYGVRNLPGNVNQTYTPDAGAFPHSGPTRVLDVVNNKAIAPGIIISNNVIARNQGGGIDFAGDATGAGAVPLGRIINNTIVGEGTGQGIRIRDNSAPTVLNNIISNFATGIQVTNNGGKNVIVNGTLFQDNGTNGTTGSNAIPLAAGAPLFRDAAAHNYYLESGSKAIDSAVDSMNDRPALTMVRSPLGIAPSPVKSPEFDITGQLRTDDANTPNTGIGQNPFKDRGALERADVTGPTIDLVNPRDNDSEGNDADPTVSIVQSVSATFSNFELQLLDGSTDGGSGVDRDTVSSDSLVITEDGRQLIEGIDYRFSYAPSNGTVLLEPVAGIWQPDSVYVLTLSNEDRFVVQLPAGDTITDGQQFSITDTNNNIAFYEFDSGYTLQLPQTLTITVPDEGNAPGGVLDNQTFVLSNQAGSRTFEFNTGGGFNPINTEVPIPVGATADEIADAIVLAVQGQTQLGFSPRNLGNGEVHLGSVTGHTANLAGTTMTLQGVAEGVVDGDQVIVSDGTREITFEFNSVGGTSPGSRNISFTAADTQEEIAQLLTNAIGSASLGLSPTNFGDGFIHLGGQSNHTVDTGMSNLSVTGTPGVTDSIHLQVPVEGGAAGGVADGEQFTISRGANVVTFEFDSDGNSTVPPQQTIGVSLASDQDQVANQIVSLIANYASQNGLSLAPQYLGDGVIDLGETFGFEVDTSATSLSNFGVGGGAIAVPYVPHESFDTPKVAETIRDTINAGAQAGVSARLRGGRELTIEGATEVTDLSATFVPAIRDLANNPLQANQQTGETIFTILLGEPDLDFGDAPDPTYSTLFANNGARHALTSELFLGTGVSSETNGQPSTGADLDSEDTGVTFNDIFNANVDTPITVTASEAGVLDAWLDFNGDGDWSDPGEQIFTSKPIQAGDNDLMITPASQVAAGQTYARFRISSSGNLSTTGLSPDGEVEDYQINILPGSPPVAVNDNYTTDENSSLSVSAPGIFNNDTDADGDPITLLTADSTSSFGAPVNVSNDGSFTYNPAGLDQFDALPAGASLADSFTYVATDGTLESEQAFVFIEVTGVNDTPTAVADNYTVSEDAQLILSATGVLSNDFDIDLGDTFELISVAGTGMLSGMSDLGVPVTAGANGSFSYNPTGIAGIQALSAGETAIDTVTYTIRDAAGETSSTTVTMTLVGANDTPIAMNDSYSVGENSTLDVAAPGVLANDNDIDQNGNAPDDVITVVTPNVTSTRGVPVQINADGSFSYDPSVIPAIQSLAEGAELIDTFNYRISDGNGGSDVATVSITVTGENDPPEATDDSYSASENFILSVSTPGALLNDSDVDQGDSITVTGSDANSARGAVVVMQANGSFTYNPTNAADIQALSAGADLIDTFTYTIADASGVTDTATITVTVSGSNDAPVANDDSDPSFTTTEDSLLSITSISLLDNDTDLDASDVLTVRGVNGTASLTGVTSSGAAIEVNSDGTFSYDPRGSATLQALGNGDTVTDTFTYTMGDSGDLTDMAMVSIVVTGTNNAPVANDDEYTISQDTRLNVSVSAGLLANDTDSDSSPLTATVLDDSSVKGVLNVNSDGSFTYDPRFSAMLQEIPQGMTETFTFTYTLDDGEGATSTATVTLNVVGVNDPPTANDDTGFSTDEETQIELPIDTLLSNDSDPDNDSLTLTPPLESKLGVPLTVNGNNEIVYDPAGILDFLAEGDTVADEITYTIDDGNGATDIATVAVIVTGLNDDPTVTPASFNTTEDTPRVLVEPGLLLDASDADQGDELTLIDVQSPSSRDAVITFQADGSILYNPLNSAQLQSIPEGGQMTDEFTYTISDGNGGQITSTATVTVTGVNDRPTTELDTYNAVEGVVLNVPEANGVLANDTDIDTGDTLTAAVSNNISTLGATITMQSDGSFTYDPTSSAELSSLSAGEQRQDSFTYTASDTAGGNRQGTVEVTVTGTNEHPWQNETLRFDVDNNGFVSNSDALFIISRLRQTGPSALPVPPNFPIAPPPFYDVNGDDAVSLSDALEVVSFLTQSLRSRSGGEGEGKSIVDAVEKATSQSIVSSTSDSLTPVKLSARNVEIEEVLEAPSIDLFLASGRSVESDSETEAPLHENEQLDATLDSIASDVNDVWT